MPLGVLLAAPGCAWGLYLSQKEKCVLAASPAPGWAQWGSKGQGCAQPGGELLLLTACILSRLFLPFPSDLFQVPPCFDAGMSDAISVAAERCCTLLGATGLAAGRGECQPLWLLAPGSPVPLPSKCCRSLLLFQAVISNPQLSVSRWVGKRACGPNRALPLRARALLALLGLQKGMKKGHVAGGWGRSWGTEVALNCPGQSSRVGWMLLLMWNQLLWALLPFGCWVLWERDLCG